MERVLFLRLALPDRRHIRRLHGNYYGRFLGASIVRVRMVHSSGPPAPTSLAVHHQPRPAIRRRALLRDLYLRLRQFRGRVLAARTGLFLGLLRILERVLDCHPYLSRCSQRVRDEEGFCGAEEADVFFHGEHEEELMAVSVSISQPFEDELHGE